MNALRIQVGVQISIPTPTVRTKGEASNANAVSAVSQSPSSTIAFLQEFLSAAGVKDSLYLQNEFFVIVRLIYIVSIIVIIIIKHLIFLAKLFEEVLTRKIIQTSSSFFIWDYYLFNSTLVENEKYITLFIKQGFQSTVFVLFTSELCCYPWQILMNARVETLVRNIPSASTLLVDTDALVSQVSSYIAENAEVSLNLELSL